MDQHLSLTEFHDRATTLFDQDLCVIAGAGTGKTLVLVERVIQLIEKQGVAPDEVLAITFTEKAATEMRRRLEAHFNDTFFGDNVNTIHGFCFGLVREFAKQMGFATGVSVAAEMLMESIRREALTATTQLWQQQRPEKLSRIVKNIGWYGSGNTAESFFQTILGLYGRLRANGWIIGDSFFQEVSKSRSQRELVKVASSLCELESLVKEEEKKREIMVLSQQLDSAAEMDGEKVLSLLVQLQELLSGRWPAKAREMRDHLKVVVHEVLILVTQNVARPDYEALQAFVEDFDATFSAQKRARNCVDFDDLQSGALALLRNNEKVRQTVQERFQYLLVDEFQDVSPVQKQLVDQLRHPGRLFLVGDVRQSIYAFRYADLHGLSAMASDINANHGQTLSLTHNFRSRPEIIDLCNDFVEVAANRLAEGEEVGPSLLAAGEFASVSSWPLECHLISGGNRDELRQQEAVLIATRLRQIVEEKSVTISRKGDPRFGQPLGYGDMALLCRYRSSIALLHEVLLQLDIPVIATASAGFYGTREVQDLLSCLALFTNPSDDLETAALLKSPLVGLSDAALFTLATVARKRAISFVELLLDPIRSLDSLSTFDQQQIQRFLHWFKPLLAKVDPFHVYPLLEAVVQGSGFEAMGSLQHRVNVDKFLGLAAAWDNAQGGGVVPFLELSRRLAQSPTAEAQAEGLEQGDRVRLLTVHAAKGLEFPLVSVPDLRRYRSSSQPAAICDRQNRVGLKWRHLELGNLSTLVHDEVSQAIRQTQAAEELRIFYVALSRAKERLILSSTLSDRESGWLKALRQQFDLPKLADLQEASEKPGTKKTELTSLSGKAKLGLTLHVF